MSYTLVLSTDQLNLILGALSELPAKVSMGMIQNIQSQCTQQDQQSPVEVSSQED